MYLKFYLYGLKTRRSFSISGLTVEIFSKFVGSESSNNAAVMSLENSKTGSVFLRVKVNGIDLASAGIGTSASERLPTTVSGRFSIIGSGTDSLTRLISVVGIMRLWLLLGRGTFF